jgi:Uma2 family endonuclease
MDFGTDRRFELVDGVIQMMSGGSADHSRVASNIYFFLRLKLRGSGCQPFNSDMAVRVNDTNVRYPDVAVYCGDPWSREQGGTLAFAHPRVIFEVLSPNTSSFDQGTKLEEYRWLPSLEAVVFVDPVNELTRMFARVNGDSWLDSTFAQPHDVVLPSLGVTLTAAEIFARD